MFIIIIINSSSSVIVIILDILSLSLSQTFSAWLE